MRSVWSRLWAGSRTEVAPSAKRPARSTADFTCALAAADVDLVAPFVDGDAGPAQAAQGRPAVLRLKEPRHPRGAVRDGAEDSPSVRDGLIPRHAEHALERAPRGNDQRGHDRVRSGR